MNLTQAFRDGRYWGTLPNGFFQFDLRIDIQGAGQISGDKVDVRNGGFVFTDSFKADQFQWNDDLSQLTVPLTYYGSGASATLIISLGADGVVTALFADAETAPAQATVLTLKR